MWGVKYADLTLGSHDGMQVCWRPNLYAALDTVLLKVHGQVQGMAHARALATSFPVQGYDDGGATGRLRAAIDDLERGCYEMQLSPPPKPTCGPAHSTLSPRNAQALPLKRR